MFNVFEMPWDMESWGKMTWLERAFVLKRIKGSGWISAIESVPYNYRPSPDMGHGYHEEYDEIVGASVGWNQLTDVRATHTTNGVTLTNNGDGSITINGTATASGSLNSHNIISAINGHVYAIIVNGANYFNNGHTLYTDIGGSTALSANSIRKATSTANGIVSARASNGESFSNQKLALGITDLTLALGSTIADYVYTLEQSTAGSGVAWLKTHFPRLFDNGYQPYDSGSIKSVSGLTAHEMVGVNQWDEEWENGWIDGTGVDRTSDNYFRSKDYISVIPNTAYYFNLPQDGSQLRISYWDKNKVYLGNVDKNNYGNIESRASAVRTTPNACHYIRFWTNGTTYNNDICINLSDTSINGQYFPYEKHTYPLDSSVTLRGKYKLDANNNLYAVGDVYASDGSVTRRYGIVDLGTLNWNVSSASPSAQAVGGAVETSVPFCEGIATSVVGDLVCSKYVPNKNDSVYAGAVGICITSQGRLKVYDTDFLGKTTTEIKSMLSGVMVVYPAVTPTTETATPYTNPQWCDANGTEEYVSTSIVPVGHQTKYALK